MASRKRKFEDISTEDKYNLYMNETENYLGTYRWSSLMILVLATKFDSLCLFVPGIINEDRKFTHHALLSQTFTEYREQEYNQLTGEGSSGFEYNMGFEGLIWTITKRLYKHKPAELTGVLLLPEILRDDMSLFYDQINKCIEKKFTKELDDRKLSPPKWRKLPGYKRRKLTVDEKEDEDAVQDYKEYALYKTTFNQKDSPVDQEYVGTEEDDDDDTEYYIPDDELAEREELDILADKRSLEYEVQESPPKFKPVSILTKTHRFFSGTQGPRYIILPLTVIYHMDYRRSGDENKSETIAHAEVLIFDRKKAILQQFDPNGDTRNKEYLEKEMINQLKNAFQGFYKNLLYLGSEGLPLKVIRSKKICMNGAQAKLSIGKGRESKRMMEYIKKKTGNKSAQKIKDYIYTMQGTCTMWSFIFMYLMMYYPDTDYEKIIEIMIKPTSKELDDIIFKVTTEFALIADYIAQLDLNYRQIIEVLKEGTFDHILNIQTLFGKP